MWITSSLNTVRTPTAVALGNFDGVHRGHQRVFAPILQRRSWQPPPSPNAESVADGPIPTVVTFVPHPREFFSGDRRLLLTPLNEKVRVLDQLGMKQLMLLPFDHNLAHLSPHDFVKQILIDGLQAQYISVGQDFCFGRDRKGTTDDLRAIASSYGAKVTIVPLYTDGGDRISSSAIRRALADGNVDKVNHLLGRPYGLNGTVIRGQQLGRTIGFPTANLDVTDQKLLPRQGVYAVWVEVEGSRQPGVMNIGQRPTVGGVQQTIEVHLLDWTGDLYGRSLTVELCNFLRPEQKFDSLDALKQQIHIDCDRARQQLSHASCDPIH